MDVCLCLFRRMPGVSGPGEACAVDSSGISHKKLTSHSEQYIFCILYVLSLSAGAPSIAAAAIAASVSHSVLCKPLYSQSPLSSMRQSGFTSNFHVSLGTLVSSWMPLSFRVI